MDFWVQQSKHIYGIVPFRGVIPSEGGRAKNAMAPPTARPGPGHGPSQGPVPAPAAAAAQPRPHGRAQPAAHGSPDASPNARAKPTAEPPTHARALGAELVAKVIDGEKLTEERSVRQVSQTARRCRVRATETEFDPSRQSRRHCAQQCVATVRRDSARDGGSPRRSAVSRRSPRVPAG